MPRVPPNNIETNLPLENVPGTRSSGGHGMLGLLGTRNLKKKKIAKTHLLPGYFLNKSKQLNSCIYFHLLLIDI